MKSQSARLLSVRRVTQDKEAQEDRRDRRDQIRETGKTSCHGGPDSPKELERYISTRAEGMDTKAWENREASSRDSRHG